MAKTVKQKWLIKDDGAVYGYTTTLAKRKDMLEFVGTLKQAQKTAGKPVEDKFPEPFVLKGKELEKDDDGVEEGIDADKNNNILAAVTMLDKTNPEHYTRDGKPRVEAIEQVMGDDITSEERDLAMAGSESQQEPGLE